MLAADETAQFNSLFIYLIHENCYVVDKFILIHVIGAYIDMNVSVSRMACGADFEFQFVLKTDCVSHEFGDIGNRYDNVCFFLLFKIRQQSSSTLPRTAQTFRKPSAVS